MELYENENMDNENKEGEKVSPFENTNLEQPLFDWQRYTIDSEELNKTSVQDELIPEDIKDVDSETEQITTSSRKNPLKKKIQNTAFFWLAVVIFTLSCGATVLYSFPQLAKCLNLQSVFASITSSITTSATGTSNGTEEPQVWFDDIIFDNSFSGQIPSSIAPSSSSILSSRTSSKISSKISVSLPKISSSINSQVSSSTSQIPPDDKILTVLRNGVPYTDKSDIILAQVVSCEMGSDRFNMEALKAQVVAAHSYILYCNEIKNKNPFVSLKTPTEKVKQAVAQVINKKITVNGQTAFTPYFAMSAGKTNSSKDVWGEVLPNLQSVISSYENESLTGYKSTMNFTKDDIIRLLKAKNIDMDFNSEPSNWFKVSNRTDGGYNNEMTIGGVQKYYNTIKKDSINITGRWIREDILHDGSKMLRSAKFDISYSSSNSTFTFTTYGYGHGAGMSQEGANQYAIKEGLTYDRILKHYYTGISIIDF